MRIDLGLVLACMLAVGFLAQWIAWRVRLPAILFLLLAGLLLGPVMGLLNPEHLLGNLLFPAISLSVSVILFEGSLSLRLDELRGIGGAVRGLVSYGAVLSLLLLALTAHVFAGLDWEIALLFGALTCVTGPTVIVPMLRTVRPNARIGNTLRWEGIVIDPLGALFAVLIFEGIASRREGHAVQVFLLTVGCGALIGTLAALAMAVVLRRSWLPDYLQNFGVLATVLLVFSVSNVLERESGLLAVTVMGMVLGNLRNVHLDDILDFKEHLSTLLVSMLFILLAARLPWPMSAGTLWAGLVIFLAAQVVVRPLTVLVASMGSGLTWRERILVGWVAPRGIVAAAVSAVFALRLGALGLPGAQMLAPLVFMLIIGTVVVQSASARPLAKWLRVVEPERRGVLIYGSDKVARTIARSLHRAGVGVIVADDEWDGVRKARMEGMPTFYGNPVSRYAERHLDLSGMGVLLAMSTHRERNSLAGMHLRREFGRDKVFRLRNLAPRERDHRHGALPESLLAPPLFDENMTHSRFAECLAQGWKIKTTGLTAAFDWPSFMHQYGPFSIPLFGLDEKDVLRIASASRKLEPRPGWTVIVLVPPQSAPPVRTLPVLENQADES